MPLDYDLVNIPDLGPPMDTHTTKCLRMNDGVLSIYDCDTYIHECSFIGRIVMGGISDKRESRDILDEVLLFSWLFEQGVGE